jgi:hypothetical protein
MDCGRKKTAIIKNSFKGLIDEQVIDSKIGIQPGMAMAISNSEVKK